MSFANYFSIYNEKAWPYKNENYSGAENQMLQSQKDEPQMSDMGQEKGQQDESVVSLKLKENYNLISSQT